MPEREITVTDDVRQKATRRDDGIESDHRVKRLLLGMGAPLEKQRFGARPHSRSAYIQTSDHYGADAIATLWRH